MSADEHEKSIPERILESAEKNARDARRTILSCKERLKANPDNAIDKMFLRAGEIDLGIFVQDIKDIKEFYGKENLIS
jgi:hypothetical protein